MRQMGEVLAASGGLARVKVVQHAACASCTHKCGMEHEKKDIYVDAQNLVHARVGETVVLELSHRYVLQAALWAYGFPLVMLIAGLILATALGLSEGLALIAGLSLMAVAYVIIRFVLEPRLSAREQYKLAIVGRADTLDCLGRNE